MAINKETIPVAFVGVGYGREHFARSIVEHGARIDMRLQPIDLLPFLSAFEQAALRTGYQLASVNTAVYNLARRAYAKSGSVTIRADEIRGELSLDKPVISVSSIATQILAAIGHRQIWHIIGDRTVTDSDTSDGVSHYAFPADDITGLDLTSSRPRVNITGVPQPATLMDANADEKRRRLEFDATPHIFFSVNGAGSMGRLEYVVRELAPFIEKKRIKLTVFVGHHNRELARLKRQTGVLRLSLQNGSKEVEADNGVIYQYAPDRQEAIRLRMGLLPGVDLAICASPMEMVNLPFPVIIFPDTARNTFEIANAKYARSRGWGIDGNPQLGEVVRRLLTPVNGQTSAQQMFDLARNYNHPEAATLFLEQFRRG